MVEQQEGLLGRVPLKHVARLVQLDMCDVLWWSPELVLPRARGREQGDLFASLQLCLDALVEVRCHLSGPPDHVIYIGCNKSECHCSDKNQPRSPV